MAGVLPLFGKSKLTLEARRIIQKCDNSTLSTEELIQLIKKSSFFYVEQLDEELKVFLDLVFSTKPRVVCEIGAYRGGSLFMFSRVCPEDALMISIDINFPQERKKAYKFFARQKQRVISIEGDTSLENTLNAVKRSLRGEQIDLLFIDGDHSFFGVTNDFIRYSPLVKHGGLIAFHDINSDSYLKTGVKSSAYVGEVPIFWAALKQTYKSFQEIISDPSQDGYGIGIIFKNW